MVAATSMAVIFFMAPIALANARDTIAGQSTMERLWLESWSLMDRTPPKSGLPFQDCFDRAARKYDLPLPLLYAVARGESNFDPRAVSHKSCLGVMQIRWPGTANDLGITRREDLFDPCTNIDAGARYLAGLIRSYGGNLYFALAAYNYGPGAIRPGRIPDGAHWYASYIYGHLQHVLSPSGRIKMGRGVIRAFGSFHEAALFVSYLNGHVPDLRLRISTDPRRTFEVHFNYESPDERSEVIRRIIQNTGIKPQAAGHY